MSPDYKYIIDGERKHKSSFRKSKLFTSSDSEDMTENQYMKNMDVYKIYDCGKIKFENVN